MVMVAPFVTVLICFHNYFGLAVEAVGAQNAHYRIELVCAFFPSGPMELPIDLAVVLPEFIAGQ